MSTSERTSRDLKARGYRLVGQGRHPDYINGGWKPVSYSLRDATDSWVAIIDGVASKRQIERAQYGRQMSSYFIARNVSKRSHARRPFDKNHYKTAVAAAHAFLDYKEERAER